MQRWQHLRQLDIDDLIILSLLAENHRHTDISKMLNLTPPAICHRLNKYRAIFGEDIFIYIKNNKKISPKGIELGQKSKKTLQVLLGVESGELILTDLIGR